ATFPPMRSGGADYTFRLSQELAGRGLHVKVLTSVIEGVVADASMQVSPSIRDWSWADLPRLVRTVRQYAPDVVDIHFQGPLYKEHPMITFVPSVIKRVNPRVRVVTHIEYPRGVDLQSASLVTRLMRKIVALLIGRERVDYNYGTILRDSDRIIVL